MKQSHDKNPFHDVKMDGLTQHHGPRRSFHDVKSTVEDGFVHSAIFAWVVHFNIVKLY